MVKTTITFSISILVLISFSSCSKLLSRSLFVDNNGNGKFTEIHISRKFAKISVTIFLFYNYNLIIRKVILTIFGKVAPINGKLGTLSSISEGAFMQKHIFFFILMKCPYWSRQMHWMFKSALLCLWDYSEFKNLQKQPFADVLHRPLTCNFTKKEIPTQVFSCEFYNIFKNSFFTELLEWLLSNSEI